MEEFFILYDKTPLKTDELGRYTNLYFARRDAEDAIKRGKYESASIVKFTHVCDITTPDFTRKDRTT